MIAPKENMITFDIERCQMFFRLHFQVYILCPRLYEMGIFIVDLQLKVTIGVRRKIELANFPILLSTRAHHQFSA